MATLLERTETLVGSGAAPDTFCRALLAEFARVLDGARTVLWRVGKEESPVCVAAAGGGRSAHLGTPGSVHELVGEVQSGQVVSTGALSGEFLDGSVDIGGLAGHLFCAVDLVDDVRLVLEVASSGEPPPKRVLLELADVFAELDRRALLTATLGRSRRFGAVMQFVSQLHEGLELRRVLNTFATDGAKLLSAKRVFVGHRRRQRWSIEAATDVESVNHRADLVRLAADRFRLHKPSERSESKATDEPLVLPVDEDEWTRARWAVQIESDQPIDRPTADLLIHHLRKAIQNCRDANSRTLLGYVRQLPAMLSRPSVWLVLALLSAAAGWLWFGTAELRITAYGQAQPTLKQTLYASEAGVVTRIFFEDEGAIAKGEVVAELRNDELRLEKERLVGEIATRQARLSALETVRGGDGQSSAATVSAEQAELRIELQSLQNQLGIVDGRIANLMVRTAMAGQVFSDEPANEWIGRPVRRGEPMVDVADRQGPWLLELQIPERDVRHVIAAMEGSENHPMISFVFETSPDVERKTALDTIDLATQMDDTGQLSTEATAHLDGIGDLTDELRRPGAGVVASIHCGSGRAGFVYFRRVLEFFERQVWPW